MDSNPTGSSAHTRLYLRELLRSELTYHPTDDKLPLRGRDQYPRAVFKILGPSPDSGMAEGINFKFDTQIDNGNTKTWEPSLTLKWV